MLLYANKHTVTVTVQQLTAIQLQVRMLQEKLDAVRYGQVWMQQLQFGCYSWMPVLDLPSVDNPTYVR